MQFCSSCDTTERTNEPTNANERTDGRTRTSDRMEWRPLFAQKTENRANRSLSLSLSLSLLLSLFFSHSGHLNAGNDRQMYEKCKNLRRTWLGDLRYPCHYGRGSGRWVVGPGTKTYIIRETLFSALFLRRRRHFHPKNIITA